MIEHWFYFCKDINEEDLINQVKKVLRTISNNLLGELNYIEILTTTNCNANCFYCYEKKYEKQTMNTSVALKVAHFISANKTNGKIKIRWYGGEPLVNSQAIDIICAELIKRNIEFESIMISNGLLFAANQTQKYIHLWHLQEVRITIDGTRTVYNKIKCYNQKNIDAFEVVFNNIDHLIANGINVKIRFNVEKYNIADIKLITKQLIKKYQGCKLISFSVNWLNNTDFNNQIESGLSDREEVMVQTFNLKVLLFKCGFKVNFNSIPYLSKHLCSADDCHHILIRPNGELAFCAESFDKINNGTIGNDIRDVKIPNLLDEVYPKNTICLTCPMHGACSLSVKCPALLGVCSPIKKRIVMRELKYAAIQEYYMNY